MSYTPHQQDALRALEDAAKKMRTGNPSAEKAYGLAYKAAVTAGVRPALKRKYS